MKYPLEYVSKAARIAHDSSCPGPAPSVEPPSFLKTPLDLMISTGATARLECIAEGRMGGHRLPRSPTKPGPQWASLHNRVESQYRGRKASSLVAGRLNTRSDNIG
ncbi:hypothetical protein AAFF_G00280420 [Aldrovandia affinis]|uniref:Ig-like domain-containing protein n=1 Tax=Aldrovandia affinis TaxID=143900 RepID=A0AAD7RAE9_9TELE|nr:hypothetical protein AAFF_G00280420 [Aldrovandia affinis]